MQRAFRSPTFGAFIGTAVVYAFFVVTTHGHNFATPAGTGTWMDNSAEVGIVSIPVALLMISGEFDLSIGSVIGAATLVLAAGTGYYHLPLWLSLIVVVALAVATGLINGIVTVRTRLPSFIVTLSTYLGLAGATLALTRILTQNTTLSLSASGLLNGIFAGKAAQFNVAIAWWLGLALLAGIVLTRTVFGNWILATGGDRETARQSGIPTDRVKIILFLCSSLGAALVGIIQALEFHGGTVGQGQQFVFDAIIVAVIGGTLLTGGYGSAIGVVFGAMTYGIVSVGIYYTGWPADWAQLILGALLLAAVLTNNYFRKLASRGYE
jgi:simple sugar transport system permease protein